MATATALAASMRALQAVAIVEKDLSGDVLPAWVYPALSPELEGVLLARSNLHGASIPARQQFWRHRGQWVYSHVELCAAASSSAAAADKKEGGGGSGSEQQQQQQQVGTLKSDRRVLAFQVCVVAAEFFPEKFARMAAALARAYTLSGGDPVVVLECYLQIFSRGRVKDPASPERALFDLAEFANPRAALLATPLTALAKLLGERVVLLWSAMLLKKRVVFVCDRPALLLKLIRAVPLLVFHRGDWDVLRPYVALGSRRTGDEADEDKAATAGDADDDDVDDDSGGFGPGAAAVFDGPAAAAAQLADLSDAGHYVAGFTDREAVAARDESLYDLIVDCNERTADIASHATADFQMTPLHKGVHDVFGAALALGDDAPPDADAQLIKAVALKTKGILDKLESIKRSDGEGEGESFVDAQALEAAGVTSAALKRFLFNIAVAERMTKA